MKKDLSVILRLPQREKTILDLKSDLLGTTKSQLLRDGAFSYWNQYDEQKWSDKVLKTYQNGDESTQKMLVDIIFEYYRIRGYPHRQFSSKELLHQMEKISSSKCPFLSDDHLQVNNVGVVLANYYHPHMWKVRCLTGYLSPAELYLNDERFKDAIKRWMDLGNKPNESGIRRILRTRDGTRSVVNFKPVIARYIYEKHANQNGRVLDPCAGYGGRLCGLISTGKNLFYHGIDPCPETIVGNCKMAAFYSRQYQIDGLRWPFRSRFDIGCAEDVMTELPSDDYDLIFSSPPYWKVELYDTLPTQSYIRYPDYDLWHDKFLSAVIEESYRVCRNNGYFIWNIKNYKKQKLADDSIDIAQKMGFKLVKTYKMRLANSEYHRQENRDKWHVEPILVFQK